MASDGFQKIAPPYDTEADARKGDSASVAITRDNEVNPSQPMDFDNPARVDESRADYAVLGSE